MEGNLKSWNIDVFGNIFNRKKHFLGRLEGINKVLLVGPNERLKKLMEDLRNEYNMVVSEEESYWF